MGFFHRLAGDRVVACEPGAAVNPAAVAAIAERGVGISKEIPPGPDGRDRARRRRRHLPGKRYGYPWSH